MGALSEKAYSVNKKGHISKTLMMVSQHPDSTAADKACKLASESLEIGRGGGIVSVQPTSPDLTFCVEQTSAGVQPTSIC